MLNHRKRKLSFLLLLVGSVGIAIGFALYALRQDVNLYQTPQQLKLNPLARGQVLRVGGFVANGSVHYGSDLQVKFAITDHHEVLPVIYKGILPSLFREGQGIIAEGRLNVQGIFIADQILAKHDANYKPPGV